jgi:hypothetical protein
MPNRKKEIKKKGYNIILTPSNVDAADRMAFRYKMSRSGFIDKLIVEEIERNEHKL